jgi:serine/threonine-protein kinase
MDGSAPVVRILGRYALYSEIAAGGMASVHIGRLMGPVGFSKTVAIKRMHPQFAKDPEFVSMFLDEARLAARIRHPNVVSTLDIVATGGELFLVMEYVEGESLARLRSALRRTGGTFQPAQAVSIVAGSLHGLHAAHEARNERGEPLQIVHRDMSPQNLLVGVDGIARVLDFGVAKAIGRAHTTRDGRLKGKMAYMAPEQLEGKKVDRRTDIWAAGVVLWEALTMRRLFKGENDVEVFGKVLKGEIEPPSAIVEGVPPALDHVVRKALERAPDERFATAREMARALEACMPPVAAGDLGEFVSTVARAHLDARAQLVAAIESGQSPVPTPEEHEDSTSLQSQDVPSDGAPPRQAPSAPTSAKEDTLTHLEVVTDVSTPRHDSRTLLVGVGVGVGVAMALGVGVAVYVRSGQSPAPLPSEARTNPIVTTTALEPARSLTPAVLSSASAAPSELASSAPPPPARTTKPPAVLKSAAPCTPHDFSYPDCLRKR